MDDKVREQVRKDPDAAVEEKAHYAGIAYQALTEMGVPPYEGNVIAMLLAQAVYSEKYEDLEERFAFRLRARIRATAFAARRFFGGGRHAR